MRARGCLCVGFYAQRAAEKPAVEREICTDPSFSSGKGHLAGCRSFHCCMPCWSKADTQRQIRGRGRSEVAKTKHENKTEESRKPPADHEGIVTLCILWSCTISTPSRWGRKGSKVVATSYTCGHARSQAQGLQRELTSTAVRVVSFCLASPVSALSTSRRAPPIHQTTAASSFNATQASNLDSMEIIHHYLRNAAPFQISAVLRYERKLWPGRQQI